MEITADESGEIKITIDRSDTLDMTWTLAQVIHPILLQLKQFETIYPIGDEDVPVELRVGIDFEDNDDSSKAKWHWVLDEMIYTFGFYKGGVGYGELGFELSVEQINELEERKDNGLRLFAKYYDDLWR